MNRKGTRRANGEGSIYETIKKNKKKFDNTKMCSTCQMCTNRNICNNRIGWIKCEKCSKCEECLKYCDRFYIYSINAAQISIDGKRKSVGTAKTKKEVQIKKEENTDKINNRKNIKNGNLSLAEVMRFNENEKLKYKFVGENSYNRNLNTIAAIEKHPASQKKINKLENDDIKDILSYFVDIGASQSQLEKVYDEIKGACKMCRIENIFEDIKRNTFVSDKDKKEIIAFSIEEEKQLITYINNNQNSLINDNKCDIDSITIKNLIKFALATGMRIGEICCLNKDTDINKENNNIVVSKTLTKDRNGKIVIGKYTKTGKKNKQSGKNSTRYVPFDIIFDENEFIELLEEQYAIASNISQNTLNLLFCTKDGKFITHSSFNIIFKKICRKAGIKLELSNGCNTHMTKHSSVTRMLENGMSIYAISAIVGTSVEVLQKTYAHILDSFIEKEIEKSKIKRKSTNLNMNYIENNNCKIIPFIKTL